MSDKRRNIQLQLAFMAACRGEAPRAVSEGTESRAAKHASESPASTERLMGRIARRVSDKRLLNVLRAFLNAGVMENGLVGPTKEGTPQGGPLSPLLSNIVLDDLDRELERRGYFGFCETPSVLGALDSWIRRRLRCVVWKQWKRGRKRFAELRSRGVGKDLAAQTAGGVHGPWRISRSPALSYVFPSAYFTTLGVPSLVLSRNA